MTLNGWTGKTFLIDGFPRNMENQTAWKAMCTDVEILYVFDFVAPDEVCLDRTLGRGENREDDKVEVV
jgi:adenylate kinase family enzyme